MQSIRLYLDEDSMKRSLVQALRTRNVDVITALEAGMIERKDAEHLDDATEHNRVLCTFNIGDFCRLHQEYLSLGKVHAGIILMPQQQYTLGEQLRRILRLVAIKSADEMKLHIEFLSGWG
jgi:hypothetical protein